MLSEATGIINVCRKLGLCEWGALESLGFQGLRVWKGDRVGSCLSFLQTLALSEPREGRAEWMPQAQRSTLAPLPSPNMS